MVRNPELKSKYNPIPFHNRDGDGKHVAWSDRAQKAAEHLSNNQWGNIPRAEVEEASTQRNNEARYKQHRIITQEDEERYNIQPPSVEEVTKVIQKIKRRKAPGPDEIPIEISKELSRDNLDRLTELFEEWWKNESMPEEELRARVVLIFKKGDTNKFENYRPISLLNTFYKIFAAVLQRRNTDKHLQNT